MLIQIVVVEQDVALRRNGRVPAGAARLLDVVFQRVGDIVVDHQPHVLFIHAHPKSGGCDDDPDLSPDEGVLVGDLVCGIHLPVVRPSGKAVASQLFRQLPGPSGPGDVDDGGAAPLLDQGPEHIVLALLRFLVEHRIAQVFPGSGGGKQLQLHAQLVLEIVADVADNLLLGGGGEAGHGNRGRQPLLGLQFPDKIADIQVIHPKILSPGGEAVGLVNDKAHHVPGEQQRLNGAGAQLLRRDVKDRGQAVCHPLQRLGPLHGAEQPVDRNGVHQAVVVEVVHLILHKGLQRGDHHGQPVLRLPCHQGGELKGDGLSAAGGEYRKQRFSVHRRLHGPLLERFVMIGAELLKAKEFLQPPAKPKGIPAIGASGSAGPAAQRLYHIFDLRVIFHKPGRGYRMAVAAPDQRQGVGQLKRPAGHQRADVRVFAYHPGKLPPDRPLRSGEQRAVFHVGKEALELLSLIEKPIVDLLSPGGQLRERVHLVIK